MPNLRRSVRVIALALALIGVFACKRTTTTETSEGEESPPAAQPEPSSGRQAARKQLEDSVRTVENELAAKRARLAQAVDDAEREIIKTEIEGLEQRKQQFEDQVRALELKSSP